MSPLRSPDKSGGFGAGAFVARLVRLFLFSEPPDESSSSKPPEIIPLVFSPGIILEINLSACPFTIDLRESPASLPPASEIISEPGFFENQ